MKNVIFPEADHPLIKEAASKLRNICHPIFLNSNLADACQMLKNQAADAMVAGINYSSRDIILAVRDEIGIAEGQNTFSSLFVADLPNKQRFIISDGATCKNPTAEQLVDIVKLVHLASLKLLEDKPKIAMLSFSTFGSGGHDPSMAKIATAIQIIRENYPEIQIDGEMQLDAAVNPYIARKKAPSSPVAGYANVLIAPDINSGNILYKAIEQFAGATVAGPILLGFNAPVSDLSRGSTVEDIIASTKAVLALAN